MHQAPPGLTRRAGFFVCLNQAALPVFKRISPTLSRPRPLTRPAPSGTLSPMLEAPGEEGKQSLKGRSGRFRKSYAQQDVIEVLASSLRLIRRFIRDESIPIERRIEIAAKFALKTIPESIHVAQTVTLKDADRIALIEAFRIALKNPQIIPHVISPEAQARMEAVRIPPAPKSALTV